MKVEFKTKKGIGFILAKEYSKGLLAGWLIDKIGSEPDFTKRTTLAGGIALKRGLKGTKTIKGVVSSLERGKRPVFSKPSEEQGAQEFKDVLSILSQGLSKIKEKGEKSLKNLATAIFTKPILLGVYRKESKKYLAKKGFSRPTILTGETLKGVSSELFNLKQGLKDPLKIK